MNFNEIVISWLERESENERLESDRSEMEGIGNETWNFKRSRELQGQQIARLRTTYLTHLLVWHSVLRGFLGASSAALQALDVH